MKKGPSYWRGKITEEDLKELILKLGWAGGKSLEKYYEEKKKLFSLHKYPFTEKELDALMVCYLARISKPGNGLKDIIQILENANIQVIKQKLR